MFIEMAYIPVLLLVLVGVAVGLGAMGLSSLLGPKFGNRKKDSAFECGVPPVGDAQHRVSVRFYLIGILFLLFDVEAIFFFPWAVVFKKYLSISNFILLEMGFFVGILLVGYYYVIKKGALEWE